MLVSNFRIATADVDAVAAVDQNFIDTAAQTIAARHNWPRDWINDGVRTYLSPQVEGFAQHTLFRTYPNEQAPGLRVFVPTAEYMLAMKLMALRIEEGTSRNDLEDILNLMQVTGIKQKADIVQFAAAFYPKLARVLSWRSPLITCGMNITAGWKGPPMNRPSTLAEVAQKVSAGAPFGPTLREFLDEFYMNPERRAAMIADEPPALKDPHHHAMLGAVGEHLARRWNLPIAPTWTDHPSRFCTSHFSRHQFKT